jgi:probable F420-dependent oxidoreductase
MDVTPEAILEIALRAEESVFESVWVNDHVVLPDSIRSPYPFSPNGASPADADTPYADPLTTLAFVAGATSRVRLGVSVLVLPYRHPLDTAKRAATLDLLSGGRLVLGVGVGWMREEFDALGVDFDSRVANFDEQLQILRAAWTQPRVAHQGTVFSFDPVGVAPRPSRPDGVELWLGGHAAGALRRACRYATAVHWVSEPVNEIRRRAEALRVAAQEVGLERAPTITLRGNVAIGATDRMETGLLAGSESFLVNQLRALQEVGVTHFLIDRRKGGMDAIRSTFTELAPVVTELGSDPVGARTSDSGGHI